MGFKLTILMVIDTDCIRNCKSSYHAITTITVTQACIWYSPDSTENSEYVNGTRAFLVVTLQKDKICSAKELNIVCSTVSDIHVV